ncbi:MAG: cation diffusion facilitator family transporter [Nitriliruptorales bacterium]|nr:cation diffusion facilitator family transporter [Nitriliruptorales bacterium]
MAAAGAPNGADHGHVEHRAAAQALSGGERYRSRLALSFGLITVFFVVELVGALLTNSLALLSDAGHMLTDVVGLGMALAAIQAAARSRRSGQRSYGLYRLEILAALANAGLLFAVACYVLYEAYQRFLAPPEVPAIPLLAVATAGLAANLVVFALLRQGASESLNLRGAYLEVLADLLGSVGVIIAAVVLATTGWPYADPIVAAAIGVFILPRTLRLGREALRILLQAAPPEIPIPAVRDDLAALDGVVDVHDLHVWTLTSSMEVLSAHVMTRVDADAHRVLDQARALLIERYDLGHATLQVEPESHEGCHEMHW